MTNTFNINVGGGSAAFGSASQGDGATINATATVHAAAETAAASVSAEIARLAETQQRSDEEVKAVLAQLRALKDLSSQDDADAEKGGGILKLIRDNYSWAYPVVKDFLALAWPAVIAVL
jgi:hypothetical protein